MRSNNMCRRLLVSSLPTTSLLFLVVTNLLTFQYCGSYVTAFSIISGSGIGPNNSNNRQCRQEQQEQQRQIITPRSSKRTILQSTPLPSHYYLELLIQAATSDSNGYPIGGDFAGLGATFDPSNGKFIPIPEHLVPEALIEWGQAPKCLEMLVSEDFKDEVMLRNTITILPDIGCGVDNLETTKIDDEIDVSFLLGEENSPIVGLQYPTRNDEIRLETIFAMDGGLRMRVVIDLSPSNSVFAVQSPMVLAMERRTSSSSSSGVIADGGGLDGRTVSMLLGEQLRQSKTFVEDEPLGESFESDGIRHAYFPGNVGIAYGWQSNEEWVLQISHVHENKRRVISRIFSMAGEDTVDFKLDSWEETIQEY